MRKAPFQQPNRLLLLFLLIFVNGPQVPHCSSWLPYLLEGGTSNVFSRIWPHLVIVIFFLLDAFGGTCVEGVVLAVEEEGRSVHMEELIFGYLADVGEDGEAVLLWAGVGGGEKGFIERVSSRELRLTSVLHNDYYRHTKCLFIITSALIFISPPEKQIAKLKHHLQHQGQTCITGKMTRMKQNHKMSPKVNDLSLWAKWAKNLLLSDWNSTLCCSFETKMCLIIRDLLLRCSLIIHSQQNSAACSSCSWLRSRGSLRISYIELNALLVLLASLSIFIRYSIWRFWVISA